MYTFSYLVFEQIFVKGNHVNKLSPELMLTSSITSCGVTKPQSAYHFWHISHIHACIRKVGHY